MDGGVGRLRGRATFEELRASGVRRRSGPLTLIWAPGPGRPCVGYAISRQVGTAVARNRLRRRLRAVMAARSASLAAGSYLLSLRPEGRDLRFPELDRLVGAALAALPAPAEA